MAIIGTQEDDPNQPSGQPASQTGGTGGNTTGGASGYVSGGTGQGATTTVSPSTSGAPTSSGNYTNLQQYLAANQGSGATTGQAAENVVQQSADQATAAQNQYKNDAAGQITGYGQNLGVNQDTLSKINAGGAGIDQGVIGAIKAGGAGTSGKYTGPQMPSVSYSGPDAAATNNAAYTGPSDVTGLTGQAGDERSAAEKANQNVQGYAKEAAGGQSGISSLLRSTYQQPSYTAGENGLDAFLAGNTAGGAAALGKAGGVNSGVQSNYSGINSVLNNQITGEQNQAKTTNAAYDTARTTAQGTAAQTAAAYKKAYDDAQAAAKANYVAPAPPPPTFPAGGGGNSNLGSGASQAQTALNSVTSPISTPVQRTGDTLGNASDKLLQPVNKALGQVGNYQSVLNSIGQGFQGTNAGQATGNVKNVISGKKKIHI